MENRFQQDYVIVGRDFVNAGKVSTQIKEVLRGIGIPPSVIRRVAIAAYEAEMNVILYARKGVATFTVTPEEIKIIVQDEGMGIEDIELAMQEGYSTATDDIREMGFGAGMGLPNIKKNADEFVITSVVGKGTRLEITVKLTRGQNDSILSHPVY